MLNQELFLESTGYVTQKELPAPKHCSCLNPIGGSLNVIFKRLQWINQWGGWGGTFIKSWSVSRRATSYYQVIAIPGKHWINHDGLLLLGRIHFGWFCLLLWRFVHFCQDPAIIRLNESRQSISGLLSPPSLNIRSQILQSWWNLI